MNTGAPPFSVPATNITAPASHLREDIRGIKAPVEIPGGWAWLWWALAAAALALVAWWLWRRSQKKEEAPSLPPLVPPHEKALENLRQALALIDQPRPFCIAVSDAVRFYLEERFDLRAPERTTEEFLDELQSSPVLMFDQKQTLGEFLARCDLVKFARYEPSRAELEALHQAAVRLVEETQPPPPAANPSSSPAQGVAS
jgi:hypothetical protein